MGMKEEVFTASGTWTQPSSAVTRVDVIVVGGGGPTGGPGVFGGGGQARYRNTAVSGPVPVTIGAGGSVGTVWSPYGFNVPWGQAGGTSHFGPPGGPTTITAEGGGGHWHPSAPVPYQPFRNAPVNGGGGGTGGIGGYSAGWEGGYPGGPGSGGGNNGGGNNTGNNTFPSASGAWNMIGWNQGQGTSDGYGWGGKYESGQGYSFLGYDLANHGGGGALGSSTSPPSSPYPGAAGVVVVQWYE
jgi:hypothetical protein